MAEAFPVSGNIEPLSFPHLLVDLHRHGATGSLKVTGPVHPKALYFRGGRVLFGSSNDPRDQLGAILIESGRITRDQLDEVNAKVGPGNPLAKVLAESGFVNQRELGEAARMKVESILADVLAWEAGSFEFEDGVLPKGAVDLKLSTEKLLLAAVQRIKDRAFALRHVELATVLEPSPEGESALSEVRADVWPLFERLDGRRTLKDAIALTRLDDFEAVKTACAMLFLGIVRKAAGASPELDLAEEAQSGLVGEAADSESMYTVPLTPVAVADLPPSSGFAFADATPGYPVPEPVTEPTGAAAASVPEARRDEPFPEVEPEPEPEPPVFSAETTMLPQAAPIFTMADYLKQAGEQPEPKMAFEPKTEEPSTETVFAMPAPSVVSTPPPAPEEPPASPAPYASYAPEPEPAPSSEIPYSPFGSAAAAAPPAAPAYPSFGAEEPPGVLPEPEPQPVAPVEPGPSPAGSRPSQEDLAALDALLHPAAGTKPAGERARPQKFEPQFRPPTTPPRKAAPQRPPAGARSRVPLIAAGLAGVALATVAAWYFLLRSPAPAATPRPAPPTTVAAAPTTMPTPVVPPPTPATGAAPTTAPSVAPTTAATAAPTPTPAPVAPPSTTLAQVPSPTPRPTPAQALPAQPSGDAQALLRQGSFAEAARSFAASLAPGARNRFSHQLLTACAPETIAKAVAAASGDELFILPVTFQGRSCYRLCWGLYDSRPAAEAGRASVPAYFRQAGASPRLSPLVELLP
jgi:hypothetical protein